MNVSKERGTLINSLFVYFGEAHLVAVHVLDISSGHSKRLQGILEVCIDGKEE